MSFTSFCVLMVAEQLVNWKGLHWGFVLIHMMIILNVNHEGWVDKISSTIQGRNLSTDSGNWKAERSCKDRGYLKEGSSKEESLPYRLDVSDCWECLCCKWFRLSLELFWLLQIFVVMGSANRKCKTRNKWYFYSSWQTCAGICRSRIYCFKVYILIWLYPKEYIPTLSADWHYL